MNLYCIMVDTQHSPPLSHLQSVEKTAASISHHLCVYLHDVKLLLSGRSYLSMLYSWRGRARRSGAQCRGSVPEGTTGGNGLLSASR